MALQTLHEEILESVLLDLYRGLESRILRRDACIKQTGLVLLQRQNGSVDRTVEYCFKG